MRYLAEMNSRHAPTPRGESYGSDGSCAQNDATGIGFRIRLHSAVFGTVEVNL